MRPRSVIAAGAGLLLAALMSACTSFQAGPAPVPPSPVPTTTATAAPPPALLREGTAEQSRPFFDAVNQQTIAADPGAGGQAFTTALRAAGFPVSDMQVTADITTVGVKADSVQFSVLWKGKCLIGQYGFGEYRSAVMPVLGTGKCLVGQTRTIDW